MGVKLGRPPAPPRRGNAPLGAERPAVPGYARVAVLPSTGGPRAAAVAAAAPAFPGLVLSAAPGVQPVQLPPHYFPPPLGSTPFYPFGAATVAGPNTLSTLSADLTQVVQASEVAVVRGVGLAIQNMLATTDVRLVLRVSQGALAPVRRLPAQPVAYAEQQWDEASYLIPGPAQIDVLVTVVDGGNYPITAYYWGWLITAEAWADYYGR